MTSKEESQSELKLKQDQDAIMIIDQQGKIIEHLETDEFKKEISFDELKYIASLVSLRFRIVEFHKILGGLEMTVNIFKDRIMMTTSLEDKISVIFVPRRIRLFETIGDKGCTRSQAY